MQIDRELWLKLQQPFDQLIGLELKQRERTLQQLDLNAEEHRALRLLLEAGDQSADMNLTAPERLKLQDALTDADWSDRVPGA